MVFSRKKRLFPTAQIDARSARLHVDSPQTRSPSYKLAFQDEEFLLRDECRPVRLQVLKVNPRARPSTTGSGSCPWARRTRMI